MHAVEFHRQANGGGVETQQTIGRWAKETFPGGDDLSPRHCLRALEECVELCLAAGAAPADIDEAVARIVQDTETKGKEADPVKVPEEIADVAIVLYVLAERRGIALADEIDGKMKRNRARRWNVRSDGTGYHRPESDPVDGRVSMPPAAGEVA